MTQADRRAQQAEALLLHLWQITGPGERKQDAELHGALHDFLRNIGRNQFWVERVKPVAGPPPRT